MTKSQARRYTYEQLQNMRAFSLEIALDNNNPRRKANALRKAAVLLEVMNEKHEALEKAQSIVKPSTIRDTTSDVIAYENGEMDEAETIEFFQRLVDTGLAWQLQGSYGRTANDLLRAGLITQNGETDAQFDERQRAKYLASQR